MDIIIVGCGKVGATLTEELSKEKHDVTVIDINNDKIKEITNSFDVMGVTGNGASYTTQIEAGIEKAELLIAVTQSDELNLLCCMFAKKIEKCQTIARVRNPVYRKDVEYIKEELGISMIINPEFAVATEAARLLRFPSAVKIDTFSKGRVELIRFKAGTNIKLQDHTIKELRYKLKYDFLICAVERNEEVIIPDGNFVIKDGDMLSVVATPENYRAFFDEIGITTNKVKDAIIIGGGKTTYYLAEQLNDMGISLRIIERDMNRCEELSELLPKATVICGDGTDKNLLMEVGFESTEAFVTLTNMDEENMMLSLFAKQKTKAKIIAKVNRTTFFEVINELDVGSIIYPKYITVNYILKYVRGMESAKENNIETLYKILDNKAEAIEFRVTADSVMINKPLLDMNLKPNLIVGSINRSGKVIIPSGKDEFMPGDSIIVVTTTIGLKDLRDILNN